MSIIQHAWEHAFSGLLCGHIITNRMFLSCILISFSGIFKKKNWSCFNCTRTHHSLGLFSKIFIPSYTHYFSMMETTRSCSNFTDVFIWIRNTCQVECACKCYQSTKINHTVIDTPPVAVVDKFTFYVIWQSEADHFRSTSSHSDVKNIDKWKKQTFSSQKISGSGDRRIRKSLSHKDLARLHDGYSVRFFFILKLYCSVFFFVSWFLW